MGKMPAAGFERAQRRRDPDAQIGQAHPSIDGAHDFHQASGFQVIEDIPIIMPWDLPGWVLLVEVPAQPRAPGGVPPAAYVVAACKKRVAIGITAHLAAVQRTGMIHATRLDVGQQGPMVLAKF